MNETNIQPQTQQLPVPPKPQKTSLSELRNTDLVSRLLAATPPYLYNIPLTPNSYFFSEMLRSLVQAKADNSNRQQHSSNHHHGNAKRSRKRSWTQTSRSQEFQRVEDNLQHLDMGKERPLELTMGKNSNLNLSSAQEQTNYFSSQQQQGQQVDQNLMLPPALPPVWYPPMYHHPSNANPYGIDPLHFFIDLRVSGHIYDRKSGNQNQDAMHGFEEQRKREETGHKNETLARGDFNYFRATKHSSAFRVPNQKNPMDLSKFESQSNAAPPTMTTKFDVKSLGFEKDENKIGSHYIMKNVSKIYEDIKTIETKIETSDKIEVEDPADEAEKKRVKDLRALIGLELVVDYVESNQTKPDNKNHSEDSSSSDVDESVGSPSVDVEMCQEDEILSENN